MKGKLKKLDLQKYLINQIGFVLENGMFLRLVNTKNIAVSQ